MTDKGDAFSLQAQLAQGCAELGLSLSDETLSRLINYLQLLIKWNRAFNLTSVRDPAEMVTKHLLDSLSICPHLSGERFLDVGTGAGLPGMVIAISFPQMNWVLLDSNIKKTRFLDQVVIELGLDNVQVIHARMEDYHPEYKFNMVVSRAVGSVGSIFDQVKHTMEPSGKVLLMKGKIPAEALSELAGVCEIKAIPLEVPALHAQRTAIILCCPE